MGWTRMFWSIVSPCIDNEVKGTRFCVDSRTIFQFDGNTIAEITEDDIENENSMEEVFLKWENNEMSLEIYQN